MKLVRAADLDGWPTARLLALRDRLLSLEASLARSDVQRLEEVEALDSARVRFKDDPRWVELYAALKRVLAARARAGDPVSERRASRSTSRPRRGR